MLNFLKLSFIFAFFMFAEAEIKRNEKSGPIEVTLTSKNNGKVSTPKSSLIDNKEIELKIRSDDREGGKVDLIIEATKDVQTSERKIDRYSPAFNSEHDLILNGSPLDLKSDFQRSQKWGASRQDLSMLYPQHNSDLFPYLMLRQVLQTPQPFLLGENQFSPLQNLKYFEDKLQQEISPHVNRGINPMSMGVVTSQPIFTGVSQGLIGRYRYPNSPETINVLQNLPIQQNGLYPAMNFPQQAPLVQSLPFNRYPLVNRSPNGGIPVNNRYAQLSNALTNNVQSPYRQLDPLRAHQSLPKNDLLQGIPEILGPNKQPLPINDRPSYTLDRNPQSIGVLLQRRPYQGHAQHHQPNQENIPKQINHGTQNYHQNRESQLAQYKSILNEQPQQNLHSSLYRAPINQHRTAAHSSIVPDNQQHLYINPRNVPNVGYNRVIPFQNSPQRDFNPEAQRASQVNPQPPLHQNIHSEQKPSIDLRNPILQNRPDSDIQDGRKIPVYHSSPEGARPLDYRNQQLPSEAGYSGGLQPERYPLQQTQSHFQNTLPGRNHQQIYQEPSYGSLSRNAELGSTDSSNHSEDLNGANERINKHEPRAPTRRRKLRNRKRLQQDKIEDLEGHSSREYIIKIG